MKYLLFLALFATVVAQAPMPSLHRGDSVYVVAADMTSRNSAWRVDLDLQMAVEKDFRKDKRLIPVVSPEAAQVVFFIARNAQSKNDAALAVAVTPAVYHVHGGDLEALRSAAFWSSEHAIHGTANRVAEHVTLHASRLFHRPSSSRALVKTFLDAALPR